MTIWMSDGEIAIIDKNGDENSDYYTRARKKTCRPDGDSI